MYDLMAYDIAFLLFGDIRLRNVHDWPLGVAWLPVLT